MNEALELPFDPAESDQPAVVTHGKAVQTLSPEEYERLRFLAKKVTEPLDVEGLVERARNRRRWEHLRVDWDELQEYADALTIQAQELKELREIVRGVYEHLGPPDEDGEYWIMDQGAIDKDLAERINAAQDEGGGA